MSHCSKLCVYVCVRTFCFDLAITRSSSAKFQFYLSIYLFSHLVFFLLSFHGANELLSVSTLSNNNNKKKKWFEITEHSVNIAILSKFLKQFRTPNAIHIFLSFFRSISVSLENDEVLTKKMFFFSRQVWVKTMTLIFIRKNAIQLRLQCNVFSLKNFLITHNTRIGK